MIEKCTIEEVNNSSFLVLLKIFVETERDVANGGAYYIKERLD